MNYYPYFNYMPLTRSRGILGLLAGRNFSLSSILGGTQKVLGVVNQTIPLVKSSMPVLKNARTMFKVMNEFKKSDEVIPQSLPSEPTTQSAGPTFFA